jgi:hypothetical protein
MDALRALRSVRQAWVLAYGRFVLPAQMLIIALHELFRG